MVFGTEIPDGVVASNHLGQGNSEGGAFSVGGLNRDITIHELDDIVGDGQSEAGTLNRLVLDKIQSLEFGKKLLLIGGLDADTGVRDRDTEGHHGVDHMTADIQADHAFLGVFYRVGQKVDDNLAQSGFIPVEILRKFGIHVDLQLKILFHSFDIDHIQRVI